VTAGNQQVIRLAGVDAAEEGQRFASESKEHLSQLVLSKEVCLDCSGGDPYGRLVCKVVLPTSEDVDLDQIKAGMAWHYEQYQRLQSATDRSCLR
jgi:endonuclease YncB( thermonuclease family)